MKNKILLDKNLQGFQHLGVPVTNLNRSVSFYSKLGFKQVMSAQVPKNDDVIHVAMMKHKTIIIELYQLTGDELKELRSRSDGHIDHIAFDVSDVDKAFAELKAAEFETIEDAPVFLNFWNRGCKYFGIRGPDGEKLEFNQIL